MPMQIPLLVWVINTKIPLRVAYATVVTVTSTATSKNEKTYCPLCDTTAMHKLIKTNCTRSPYKVAMQLSTKTLAGK